MLDAVDENADIRNISRQIVAISQKYPLTTDERVALEHLWVQFEDKRLDAELEEMERMEMST